MKRALTLLLIGLATAVYADTAASLARVIASANALFAEGKIDAAQQLYAAAQVDAPESPHLAFNLATTLYRQGKYDQALAAFQKALGADDVTLVAQAHYNIGNTLVQQGKLREALDAYKHCLELTRDDEDAKYNIEYIQRKLKELASKQKDEQEKDPLNKLLKELEKLIALQAAHLAETRALAVAAPTADTPVRVHGLQTNEAQYAARTAALTDGFRDLRTNLPPEQLLGGAQAGAQLPQDANTRALAALFEALLSVAEPLNTALKEGQPQAATNALDQADQVLAMIEQQTADDLNRQFAGAGRDTLRGLRAALAEPGKLEQAASAYQSLMESIEGELRSRLEGAAPSEDATNVVGKTLAQKMDNAIVYLDHAYTNITAAAAWLSDAWTNAPPDQAEGLAYLILARKEFEDDKQQQQQQQQGGQGQQDQQDNKDQQNQQGEQGQQDQQDNQDQQDQNGAQDQDKRQDQQPQDEQQGQPQPRQGTPQDQQPQMDPQQVEQMLRAFGEDQRNQRRTRQQQAPASGYMPVDKDW